MLSMQTLASDLKVDSTWLLSHAELSRVAWKRGSRQGEILVEIDSVEGESQYRTSDASDPL